jgi:hypothetical protein
MKGGQQNNFFVFAQLGSADPRDGRLDPEACKTKKRTGLGFDKRACGLVCTPVVALKIQPHAVFLLGDEACHSRDRGRG